MKLTSILAFEYINNSKNKQTNNYEHLQYSFFLIKVILNENEKEVFKDKERH